MSATEQFAPQTGEEVTRKLGVDLEKGLSASAAAERLEEQGPNKLQEAHQRSLWRVLLDQVRNIVILILVVAMLVAIVSGQWPEAIAVAAVIIINTGISFVSEWNAMQSMQALYRMSESKVKIRRDGVALDVNSEELVAGDIVLLSRGNLVAADLRILEAENLQVNEAALTGESVPVSKTVKPVAADAPLAEQSGLLFKGTSVTEGCGIAVVVATGMDTELGSISRMVQDAAAMKAPLQKRLDRLGGRLGWVALSCGLAVTAAGLLMGRPLQQMIETGIALGVAAVPEGLPIVATIALARGMWVMAQRNALIRRLSAVETLGATRIIFTDKTGTLTDNKMVLRTLDTDAGSVEIADDVKPSGSQEALLLRLLEIGVLCNNATLEGADNEDVQGDPMEVALLEAGKRYGILRAEKLQMQPEQREVPFDPSVMMMATYHLSRDGCEVMVKGAPGAVLESCSRIAESDGNTRELNNQDRKYWQARCDELAGEGLRILAFADKQVDNKDIEPYQELRFIGLVGLLDPPRPDVRNAIDECERAGIRVVMVTGDQPRTAEAIARKTGLGEPEEELAVMHGKDLKNLNQLDHEDRKQIHATDVFARVSPEQKLNLIQLYQNAGETVAMTGDGVNDAPALKKADIGIAMGQRGTDAARQVADMVLRDDAFSSIVAAVRQGRVIFGNIRKAVIFMLCTNAAEVLAVAVTAVSGAPLPLLPLQILFLNVVTDVFPALALGVNKGNPCVMHHPPRDPGEAVLTAKQWKAIAGWSILIAACVLAALATGLQGFQVPQNTAVTMSFLTLGFAKLWFVFNLREPDSRLLSNDIVRNPWIWASLALCTSLLFIAVHLPGLSDVLQTTPLTAAQWGAVLGISLIPFFVGQSIVKISIYFH
ncbi:cation-translocating P-type ATPase [Psychromonas sp.]|uniref:cation-translocating P-type ATPase n=1 Tax=Psychromonas sp. TaxID=1884585 RepID=UPI00356AE263